MTLKTTMQRVDDLAKAFGTEIEGETPVGFWPLPILEALNELLINHKHAIDSNIIEINMLKARVADLEQQRGRV